MWSSTPAERRLGVMNARVMGQGTVDDHGIGTGIVPLPNFRSQP